MTRFDSNELFQLEKCLALNPEGKFFKTYHDFFKTNSNVTFASSPVKDKSTVLDVVDAIHGDSVNSVLFHLLSLLKAIDRFEYIENPAIISHILEYYVFFD